MSEEEKVVEGEEEENVEQEKAGEEEGEEKDRLRGDSFVDVGKKVLKEVVNIGVERLKKDLQSGITEELSENLEDVDLDELQGYVFGDYKHLMGGLVYMLTHDDTWKLVRIPLKVGLVLCALWFLGLILVLYPFQAYALETLGIGSILAHFLSFGLVAVELFVIIGFVIVPVVYGTLVTRTFIHVYNDNSKSKSDVVLYAYNSG